MAFRHLIAGITFITILILPLWATPALKTEKLKEPVEQASELPYETDESLSPEDIDPFEPLNRAIFLFNRILDSLIIRPAAIVYEAVLPEPARTGISNALSNLWSPVTCLNHVLQGRPDRASATIGRFAINSTAGLLGFIDVAHRLDIPRVDTGFDDTLSRYGIGPGAYLVLPVFGPHNLRSTAGLVTDYYTDPFYYHFSHEKSGRQWPMHVRTGLILIDQRVYTLNSMDELERSSADLYVTLRSLHFQNATYKQQQLIESDNGSE